ncbi:putative Multiprotein bridging factor 1 Helix turn helix [Trypanosoma vivax]|uniref:HTH cro/C1-type domain-containing protein n=1 Tax=Trypanosoma vivax (strain Y486) TaxID=1055687 RepID=G0U4L7_TRYVY|nr:hypothetical protein TRVL_02287 [Trypanosoma vivax]KAH8611525.1 putative Multiprotein bridging factor 1 Helix turn helix [Trypanosoma vivax]CCC52381.1 conserved hypothetical protein [Trypanosoma vivax Y486]
MPRGGFISGQDWEPQIFNIHNKVPTSKVGRVTEKEANRALQRGGSVEVEKKANFRFNAQKSGGGPNTTRLDNDDETLKLKTVNNSLRLAIQKARQAKGWTQRDLAQQIAERVGIVTEYEKGTAIPDERVLVKMERAFGVHLRGANAGKPFGNAKAQPSKAS